MYANSNMVSRETFAAGKFEEEPSIDDTNQLGFNLLGGASTETNNSVSTIQEHSEQYTTSQVKRILQHPSDVSFQKRYASDNSADPLEHRPTNEICITEEEGNV